MLIYNNTVDLDYQDSGHRYTVKKKVGKAWTIPEPVVGVTTVTGIIHKPALMFYALNEAVRHIKTLPFNTDLDCYDVTEKDLKDAINAHKKKSQYGKDAGTVGHSLVEALLLGKEPEKPPDELVEAYISIQDAFKAYRKDFKPELLHTELICYSLAHNVAGKLDDISTIDGKITLTDYKTTNPSYYSPDGVYKENFCQLGGYIVLVEEMIGITVEEAQIVNLPKDGGDYKVKSLSDMGLTTTDAKLYFLNALGLYNLDGLVGGRLHG